MNNLAIIKYLSDIQSINNKHGMSLYFDPESNENETDCNAALIVVGIDGFTKPVLTEMYDISVNYKQLNTIINDLKGFQKT